MPLAALGHDACSAGRMKTPVWLACLASACAAGGSEAHLAGADLSFKVVEISAEPRLARPVFVGSDIAAAERLNAWVAEQWGSEQGCVASGSAGASQSGTYTRRLSVLRLTPWFAVFTDAGDASCPNTAHPSTWNDQYVVEIASGKTIDVWGRLSTASRARLRAQMSAFGIQVRAGDPCADEYRMDRLPEALVVAFGDEGVRLEPAFCYAARACIEALSMSSAAFTHEVETDSLVQRLLDTW